MFLDSTMYCYYIVIYILHLYFLWYLLKNKLYAYYKPLLYN